MKTYGREIGLVLFLVLGWLVYDGNVGMVEALAFPICFFGASVFTGKHISNGMLGK